MIGPKWRSYHDPTLQSHKENNTMKLTPEQEQEIEQRQIVYYLREVPAGWKLVPTEPDINMVVDGFEAVSEFRDSEECAEMSGCRASSEAARICYCTMLAAAPAAPLVDHIADAGEMVAAPIKAAFPTMAYIAPSVQTGSDEDTYVIKRLSTLLADIAIALKGSELTLHRHSYHDLAKVAKTMKLELDLHRFQESERKTSALDGEAKMGANVTDMQAALELFLDRVEAPPEKNCSCFISPPCSDCVDYGGLREAFNSAHSAIRNARLATPVAQALPVAAEKDAQRLQWLTDDHPPGENRDKCREILERMPTMSYSAACADIDAAIAAMQGEKI